MAAQLLERADELIRVYDYEEACAILESVVAMRINNDNDRRIILDAAYILTQTFLAMGAVSKSKALCRLVVNGNRVFPGRVQELKDSVDFLSKLLEMPEKPKGKGKLSTRLMVPDESAALVGSGQTWDADSIAPETQYQERDRLSERQSSTYLEVEAPARPNTLITIERTNKNDPSLTRFLFGSIGKRLMPTSDSATSISYITDFRNPSNPLSPHYTPFVTVPVPLSVFAPVQTANALAINGEDNATQSTARKGSRFFGRVSSRSPGTDRYRSVRMSRDEYLRCWARDSNGNYLGTDPEGSGDERVRRSFAASGGKVISQLEYVGHITEGRNPFAHLPGAT